MNSLKRLATPLLFTVCVSLCSWNTFSQGVIDTTGGAAVTSTLQGLGEGGITIGQTFTAPSSQLYSFSFWVTYVNGWPLNYAGYVAAWDGNHPTGPILYKSPMQTQSSYGTRQVTFYTEGIPLSPGQQYIAFLSASEFYDGHLDNGYVGLAPHGDVYPGGGLVDCGGDFTQLFQRSWFWDYGEDAAFQAFFDVPEPTSGIWMLGAGTLLLRSIRRRFNSTSPLALR